MGSSRAAGLGRREPWLGVLMTLFLLSLTGIPPTAGFFAKAYVILAAVQASQAGNAALGVLAVVAVLNAAAAAFYYLRVVVYMYMREPQSEQPPLRHGRLMWSGLLAGLGEVPHRLERIDVELPRLGVVGVYLHRVLEHRDGLSGLSLAPVRDRLLEPDRGTVRLDLDAAVGEIGSP